MPGPAADVVLLNTAASLVVAGVAADAREGVALAREAIMSGAARARLDRWRSAARAAAGTDG